MSKLELLMSFSQEIHRAEDEIFLNLVPAYYRYSNTQRQYGTYFVKQMNIQCLFNLIDLLLFLPIYMVWLQIIYGVTSNMRWNFIISCYPSFTSARMCLGRSIQISVLNLIKTKDIIT